MSFAYQPRDPRAKLRQVAATWVAAMRVTGHAPNCGVVFGDDAPADALPHAHGFLLDDRRSQDRGQRYIVLEDGDVLRAPAEQWLGEPNDDLVTLLAKALSDARMGGSGWLADGADVLEHVPDRRGDQRSHVGQERRARV